jgi:hypothetical protein
MPTTGVVRNQRVLGLERDHRRTGLLAEEAGGPVGNRVTQVDQRLLHGAYRIALGAESQIGRLVPLGDGLKHRIPGESC